MSDEAKSAMEICEESKRKIGVGLTAFFQRLLDLQIERPTNETSAGVAAAVSVASQDQEMRIHILSRSVDELFAVKRSEAVMAKAAKDLLDDVRRRYPGEDLRCPLMIALDAAVKQREVRGA